MRIQRAAAIEEEVGAESDEYEGEGQMGRSEVGAWEFLACEAVGIPPVARLDPNEGNAALRKRQYVPKKTPFQPSRYAELASIPSFSELHDDNVFAPTISRGRSSLLRKFRKASGETESAYFGKRGKREIS